MASRDKGLSRFRSIPKDARDKIDAEKRTVELSFSSEEPVERWGENEVLSHNSGDYDFGRVKDGTHPLLAGHNESDPDAQIGVIERAWVDGEKMGRAVVRFGNSARAQEYFKDVQDGIRQNISVGYDRTGIAESKKAKDGRVTTRYRWMPTHIAIVPVPADTNVGTGRDNAELDSPAQPDVEKIVTNLTPEQKKRMKILLDPAAADGGTVKVVNEAEVRAKIKEDEKSRRKEIRALADHLIEKHAYAKDAVEKAARAACEGETTADEFKSLGRDAALSAVKSTSYSMAKSGASEEEIQGYSVARAIQSCLKNGTRQPDGLEKEFSDDCQKKTGRNCEGFAIPYDAVLCRQRPAGRRGLSRDTRDLNAGTFGQGGATIATVLEMPVIELLRNSQVLTRLGIQVWGGLSSNVAIPRQTAPATAYSLPESQTLTTSTAALDQISMTPHRVGITGKYTRQLLLQSSMDVANFLMADQMAVLALRLDYLGLFGQGAASEPLGVASTPGVGSIAFGGAATFANLVKFETALGILNANLGNRGYVTTPASKGVLKSAAKLLVGATTVAAVPLWEMTGVDSDGVINGYRAIDSNQILNNIMMFGNWNDLIQGMFGGIDTVVNPYSQDTDAVVRITMNTFVDYVIRHPQSFCISSDAANQ